MRFDAELPAKGKQRLLWAWMDQGHLQMVAGGYLNSLPPEKLEEVLSRHAEAVSARKTLAPLRANPSVRPLNYDLDYLEGVRAAPFFKKSFAGRRTAFGTVSSEDLIVFQHFVNAPKGETPADIVRWVLPKEFNSQAQISQDSQGRLVFVTDDLTSIFQVTVEPDKGPVMSLQPRGNWLQVARVKERLVIRNGIHRAVRLAAMGRDIPALIVDFDSLAEVFPPDAGFFSAEYIAKLDRPPVLSDFLKRHLTLDIPKADVKRIVAVKLDVSEFFVPLEDH
jgi:hypothetical protein